MNIVMLNTGSLFYPFFFFWYTKMNNHTHTPPASKKLVCSDFLVLMKHIEVFSGLGFLLGIFSTQTGCLRSCRYL